MRPLTHVLSLSLVAAIWAPSEAVAGGSLETPEKDARPGVQTGKLTLAQPLKATPFNAKVTQQATSFSAQIHESAGLRGVQPLGTTRPPMQLSDKHGLSYHYSAGSSLTLMSHPHHLSLGWRTQF